MKIRRFEPTPYTVLLLAEQLGIDTSAEVHLLTLPYQMLSSLPPAPWRRDITGEEITYYNSRTRLSHSRHPQLKAAKQLLTHMRKGNESNRLLVRKQDTSYSDSTGPQLTAPSVPSAASTLPSSAATIVTSADRRISKIPVRTSFTNPNKAKPPAASGTKPVHPLLAGLKPGLAGSLVTASSSAAVAVVTDQKPVKPQPDPKCTKAASSAAADTSTTSEPAAATAAAATSLAPGKVPRSLTPAGAAAASRSKQPTPEGLKAFKLGTPEPAVKTGAVSGTRISSTSQHIEELLDDIIFTATPRGGNTLLSAQSSHAEATVVCTASPGLPDEAKHTPDLITQVEVEAAEIEADHSSTAAEEASKDKTESGSDGRKSHTATPSPEENQGVPGTAQDSSPSSSAKVSKEEYSTEASDNKPFSSTTTGSEITPPFPPPGSGERISSSTPSTLSKLRTPTPILDSTTSGTTIGTLPTATTYTATTTVTATTETTTASPPVQPGMYHPGRGTCLKFYHRNDSSLPYLYDFAVEVELDMGWPSMQPGVNLSAGVLDPFAKFEDTRVLRPIPRSMLQRYGMVLARVNSATGVLPTPKTLEFNSWWSEDFESADLGLRVSGNSEVGGGLRARSAVLFYDTFTSTFDVKLQDSVSEQTVVLGGLKPVHVGARVHERVTLWDVYVGATFSFLGRQITLMHASAETVQWHNSQRDVLESAKIEVIEALQRLAPRSVPASVVCSRGNRAAGGVSLRLLAQQLQTVVDELLTFRPSKAEEYRAILQPFQAQA